MFPYKHLFIKTPPREFLNNLKTLNLIEEKNDEYISSQETYDKINIITDLFTEEVRIKARICGYISPLEFWKRNKSKGATLQEQREYIYKNCKEASTFSPAIAKKIYDTYSKGTVLDPFSGWGDRAIGAIVSSKVSKYIGIDCNKDLETGYNNLKQTLDVENKITFLLQSFETFNIKEKFDLIFTSPPHYDYEIYSTHKEQSITNFYTYEEWYRNFMVKCLEKMVQLSNLIILHLGKTNRCQTFPEDVCKTLEKLHYVCVRQIGCRTNTKRPIFIYIFEKIEN